MTAELRSGRLVAWLHAWRRGLAGPDEVLDRIVGTDEPHTVTGPDAEPVRPLGRVLPEWRGLPLLVLPVPGDPRGLPGPSPCTTAALEAGEAVLLDDIGIVPQITRHGSAVGSATHSVQWQVFYIAPARPDPLSVTEAEHDMTDALREAATRLAALDVARWRPELAEALAAMRRTGGSIHLPELYDSRSRGLLDRAERLRDVLRLANEDAPGAAVNGFEARERADALADLTVAVRRARVAAYNAPSVDTTARDAYPSRSTGDSIGQR